MQKNSFFPLALIAIAVLSACTTTPPQNTQLNAAHNNYNEARNNPQVTELAALELKDAGDTLDKADKALSKGQSLAAVDHLAYLTIQKVKIAQETARQKTAEQAVANAAANRDKVRLVARTAEADQAKQQAAIATEDSKRDKARLVAKTAEADQANQQVAFVSDIADQQASDLAMADANAQRDHAIIAQQEQQLKDLNAKKTERGMVITLGDVLFRTNKSQLESGGMHNVQKLADFLKQYPKNKVLIEGHTDSTGSSSHNQALSEQRADAVRIALIDMKISSDRISIRGYGENYPVASNTTSANRQLNRRVEIIMSDDSGNIKPR